jgi:ferredoxin-thioredoxin reductase catalytic subunit
LGGDVEMSKQISEVLEYVKKIAQRYGWELTSDQEAQNDLIEGLAHNFNRYGYYNCPCRDSQNDRKLDRDIICPCSYSKQDIEEYNHCYCALYFKQGFNQGQITMIPERRPS